MNRFILPVAALLLPCILFAQSSTVSGDKEWKKQNVVLTNADEADYIIRIGDVDNLNFGWEERFDPFCSRTTLAHFFPWEPATDDLPGFDRILLSSKYKPGSTAGCGPDGYSDSWSKTNSAPVPYRIPLAALSGAAIRDAWLQLFIDDFQPVSMCSRFRITLNGKRFAEAEKLINVLDQTGPVGKLISIPIPQEFFDDLVTKTGLEIFIDESTGAPDGFALDFIRLLVNRRRENSCKGNVTGLVLEKGSGQPIANARVSLADRTSVTTDEQGRFAFADVLTGYELLTASSPGYNDGSVAADVGLGDENPDVILELEKGKQVLFNNKQVTVGEAIGLNNILFDQGKSVLRPESKPELDKVVALLLANPAAEIELGGHTSSEGEAGLNRTLSYQRVNACKTYIVSKGVDPGRIIAIGYGPDRPVAPNDTEPNRAKNRRVEMKITKL